MTEAVGQLPPEYGSLLLAVKERVRTAHYQALKAVNKTPTIGWRNSLEP
jgi:hypothetical protein